MADSDLIRRSLLVKEYEWLKHQVPPCSRDEVQEHIDRINSQPSVDAAQVVHLAWITEEKQQHDGLIYYNHTCPRCFFCYSDLNKTATRNYCAQCGAKMDGGNDGNDH